MTKPNKKHQQRLALLAGVALIVVTIAVVGLAQVSLGDLARATYVAAVPRAERAPETPDPETASSTEATLLFFGDIMLGRGVATKLADQSGEASFDFVRERISAADFAVANLEGPVSDRGANVGSKYSFRFVPEAAQWVAGAGFDLVSSANNHAWDWGRLALCDTKDHLTKAGVASVGTGCNEDEANTPYITTIGDSRVLFMSYTNLYPSSLTARGDIPGVSDLDLERITAMIKAFRAEGPGLVVIIMHWGEEYEMRSHPIQQTWAHDLIDAGTDLVIGHHPHVTQEIERYGNGWIVYSLGNFVFDQYFSEETMRGFGVEFRIQNNRVRDFSVLPYTLNSLYQPIFDDSEK